MRTARLHASCIHPLIRKQRPPPQPDPSSFPPLTHQSTDALTPHPHSPRPCRSSRRLRCSGCAPSATWAPQTSCSPAWSHAPPRWACRWTATRTRAGERCAAAAPPRACVTDASCAHANT
jgi:hypothetical protein